MYKDRQFNPFFSIDLLVVLSSYKWLGIVFIWFLSQSALAQEVVHDTIYPHQVLLNKAVKLIDSAKYKEAIPILKKALKLKPDYWEALNKMAFAKIKLCDYKEATKELEKSEKIIPLNYETVKLKGINSYLSGNFREAKVMLDTAMYIYLEEKLDDPEIFYYRALLMFKGKSFKSALETCEAGVDLKPNYVELISLKGEIRFFQKDYNYAIKELTEAIKYMPVLSPDYNVYKLRAKSRFEVGDYKGAVADWNVYIEAVPKEEESLVSRAAAKINMNDNSGAVGDLDEAIKLNGNNPVSYCYRGVAKGGNKQYVEALKDIDHAIKLKFDYATAYVNRAAIKMASKDKRGACADLEKADGLGSEMAMKMYEKYCK